MPRTGQSQTAYSTVRSEGGLLPADLLARIAGSESDLPGLTPADYGLASGERLNEAASRAWERVKAYWAGFRAATETVTTGETGVTETRELWLLPLFRELGYGRPTFRQAAEEIDGRRYPISHQAGEGADAPPLHFVSFRQDLDKPSGSSAGAMRSSPHGLLQEYLNRTDHVWGVLSNGYRLQILRDNQSLSRAAYVEFDLEAMLDGGVYADFGLLFLVAHRSSLPTPGELAGACWLETWRELAEDQGRRALDELRGGVEAAIRALGQGLLEHAENTGLRQRLVAGELSVVDYYRQLLRLVYRLLFLLAAEERDLLFEPAVDSGTQDVFDKHYGISRLRALVERRRHSDRYDDLWRSLQVTFTALSDEEVGSRLGLKPLAGGLFGPISTPDLDRALVSNARLLEAIRGLSFTRAGRSDAIRRINYRDMDVEELGSVYEGLLELQPMLKATGDRPTFDLGTSGERKSTGSYYTNRGLVRELITSALEPVIADAVAGGKTSDERRRRLLELKICDPACGSGHFLLAAARRIGREIARIDAGESEPDAALARHATREAIGHCIYGVDLNPLAVDLCKLALWLEAHEPGKPLGFLDARIRHGNSLIGATRAVMEQGIPDAAFEAVTGDKAEVARAVKKRNAFERKGNLALDSLGWQVTPVASAEQYRRYFAAMDSADDSVSVVASKAELFDRHRRTADFIQRKLAADLWTAASFWPLSEGAPMPPTHGVWSRLSEDHKLVEYVDSNKNAELKITGEYRMLQRARSLAREHAFFHWELEFEDVFGRADPGFDCILGNPPWERIKLQEQEFFASRDESISKAANAAARKRLIEELKTSADAPKRKLYAEFEAAKRASEGESTFLRGSGVYPLAGRGDVNTYSVFAELMSERISQRGRAGIIVPTGIATDDTNKHFFGALVKDGRIASLFDFENSQGIFSEVHRSYKFSLLAISGRPRLKQPIEVAFFLTQPVQLRDPDRRFTLTAEEIELLNPNTRTCPIFRSTRDAEITKQLYRAAPVLVREGPPEVNPWGITFKTLFHMSNDSHLFRTRAELEQAGYTLGPDAQFRGKGEVWLPLYEAKMIHQYDHRFATYEGPAEAERARDMTDAEHANPSCLPVPRYWVAEHNVEHAVGSAAEEHPGWFIGFRDITNATNERTAIFSVVPWAGIGNSLPILTFGGVQPSLLAAFLGNCSSLVFDFPTRQKAGGTRLNFFIVKQLPVLPPGTYTPALLDLIVPRVLELTYTTNDLKPFARDCGYDGQPFSWDPKRRAQLRAELDGIYAHLYRINRDDFAYILDTFPIVRRNDEKAFGEFRSKRLCLEAYDHFAPETLLDLDREVKRIEVGLRALIASIVGSSSRALPAEQRARLLEAQQRQLGARATAVHADSTAMLLESAMLLDLQKLLLEPGIWGRVESLAGSKSKLCDAFTGLNDLRNALVHNRSLSEKDRADGESAVEWFDGFLDDKT